MDESTVDPLVISLIFISAAIFYALIFTWIQISFLKDGKKELSKNITELRDYIRQLEREVAKNDRKIFDLELENKYRK